MSPTYLAKVDIVGGASESPSVTGPQVPPEDPSVVPKVGWSGALLDSWPARLIVFPGFPLWQTMRRYPVEYIGRYKQLIESHTDPSQREAFSLYAGLPADAHVVLSQSHGAAVIFTEGRRRSVVFRIVSKRIEYFLWPSTQHAKKWPVKTTFKHDKDETVVFVRGKRMRAGAGLTVYLDGTWIYEGRMIAKGSTRIEDWSRSAARQDALFAFLRDARNQIVDQAKLREIEAAGQLEAEATALALMEVRQVPNTNPEEYLARLNAYLRGAELVGLHTLAAEGLVREIRQTLQQQGPGAIGIRWGQAIVQSAMGSTLFFVVGLLLVKKWGWIAFIGGIVLAVLWGVWVARRQKFAG